MKLFSFPGKKLSLHWVLAATLSGSIAPVLHSTPVLAGSDANLSIGKAVNVTGRVLIRNEGIKDSSAHPLKTGDDIRKGDIINTSSASEAKLLLTDRSILDLGSTTLFKVDEYQLKDGGNRKVGLSMDYGKMRAAVNTPISNGKYQIKTKSATMGVRGTELLISSNTALSASGAKSAEKTTTQVTVVEGKVEVSQASAPKAKPVAITKGEQLTTVSDVAADKSAASIARAAKSTEVKVVKLNTEQMKVAVTEVRVQDSTFKQAVVITPATQNNSAASGSGGFAEIGNSLSTTLPALASAPPPVNPAGLTPQGPTTNTPYLPPGQPIQLQVVFKK